MFSPIVDAIGRLELDSSNIGDIWPQLILIKIQLAKITPPLQLRSFKEEIENIVEKYSKNYEDSIYIVGFFLCPRYKNIATSRKFNFNKILRFALGNFFFYIFF